MMCAEWGVDVALCVFFFFFSFSYNLICCIREGFVITLVGLLSVSCMSLLTCGSFRCCARHASFGLDLFVVVDCFAVVSLIWSRPCLFAFLYARWPSVCLHCTYNDRYVFAVCGIHSFTYKCIRRAYVHGSVLLKHISRVVLLTAL